MKNKYILETWRWNGDFDDETEFTSLKEVQRAMADLSRSEGRTLAFVHKQTPNRRTTIASRDWYAAASWKPITYEAYCDVLNIIMMYPAYQRTEQRQAA
jgi:hypothetical protein